MVGSVSGRGNFDPSQMAQNMFKKIDSDSSGDISKDEMKAFMESQKNKDTGRAQGPGRVEGNFDEFFNKIDTDGNGEISEAENETSMKKMGGPGGHPPPPPPPMDKLKSMASSMESSNSNLSGLTDILNKLNSRDDWENLSDDEKEKLNTFMEQISSNLNNSSDPSWKGMLVNSLT